MVKKELDELYSNKNGLKHPEPVEGDAIHAPNFVEITAWINSQPLSIKELRGKVVLVDFWTYSCINCVRTLPYLKKWYATYKDKGLVIIGVHTPEFEFEKNVDNVKNAVKRFGIEYPVALDNTYSTWQNYDNHYWPAHYLINQQGVIVEHHFGEGAYLETENTIRSLLGMKALEEVQEERGHAIITPETYLGYQRGNKYQPDMVLQKNNTAVYDYDGELYPDHVGLKGAWLISADHIESQSNETVLELNFSARHVYLVMQTTSPQPVKMLLDGTPVPEQYHTPDVNAQGDLLVTEPRMYNLLDLKNDAGRHVLTLRMPKGVSAYAFTFGD